MNGTKPGIDAEKYALSVAGSFVLWGFDDARWMPFGYRKTPRRVGIFKRFVDKKVLVLEGFVRSELLYVASYLTCRLVTEICRRDDAVRIVARAMEITLEGLRTWNENYRLYGFGSAADARRTFTDAVIQYVSGYPGNWHKVFADRAHKSFEPTDDLMSVLIDGSEYLLSDMDSEYQRMVAEARKTTEGQVLTGKVELKDETYMTLAERIISAIEASLQLRSDHVM